VIHEQSSLHDGPFVMVDCASLEPGTARTELFGVPGDGAVQSKPGAVEAAHGGTLVLRAVEDLSLEVQPILLAALERERVVRAGEVQERPAKVRVVATSRNSLANEVAAGRFHQDLHCHLRVVVLRSPPLHERGGDVALLAQRFAAEFGVLRLPSQVIDQLERHNWPGNVRELRNVIRGYAAVGELPQAPIEGDDQLAELLRRVLDVDRPYQQQKDHILNKFIDVYLSMLLEHTGGNQSQASRMSGIERAHLNRMIAKLRGESKRSTSVAPGAASESEPPPRRKG
jgi:DNA-binding NtrC family response regulator